MLTAPRDRPQAASASEVEGADGKIALTREVDAGFETIEAELLAVVTNCLHLNEPRFIKLPDIMKVESMPIDVIELASLRTDGGDHPRTTHYAAPPKRSKGAMVKDAVELTAILK